MVPHLNADQIDLIPQYWDKWHATITSTEAINPADAAEAVRSLYQLAEYDSPEVLFVDSPVHYYAQAFLSRATLGNGPLTERLNRHLQSNQTHQFLSTSQTNLASHFVDVLSPFPVKSLSQQCMRLALTKIKQGQSRSQARQEARAAIYSDELDRQNQLLSYMDSEFAKHCEGFSGTLHGGFTAVQKSWVTPVYQDLHQRLELPQQLLVAIADTGYNYTYGTKAGVLDCSVLALMSARWDYWHSILGFQTNNETRHFVMSLGQRLGSFLFPYEELCIICNRPRILQLDDQYQPLKDTEIAIQFRDGFSI